jgi:alcohol dehydrogenase
VRPGDTVAVVGAGAVAGGRIPAEKMGTHSFTFDQMDEAYSVFGNAAAHAALKVVITPA